MTDNDLVAPSACSRSAPTTGSWLDTAADLLGLEVMEVLDGFQRGLTLAEMAGVRGVDVIVLEDAILEALDAHVTDLVENRGVDEHDAVELRRRFEDVVSGALMVGWGGASLADDPG